MPGTKRTTFVASRFVKPTQPHATRSTESSGWRPRTKYGRHDHDTDDDANAADGRVGVLQRSLHPPNQAETSPTRTQAAIVTAAAPIAGQRCSGGSLIQDSPEVSKNYEVVIKTLHAVQLDSYSVRK